MVNQGTFDFTAEGQRSRGGRAVFCFKNLCALRLSAPLRLMLSHLGRAGLYSCPDISGRRRWGVWQRLVTRLRTTSALFQMGRNTILPSIVMMAGVLHAQEQSDYYRIETYEVTPASWFARN